MQLNQDVLLVVHVSVYQVRVLYAKAIATVHVWVLVEAHILVLLQNILLVVAAVVVVALKTHVTVQVIYATA
jgi:hypothetical protein